MEASMSNAIHLTVATLCVRAGKMLMVQEYDTDKLVLNQPAGHVEPGEGLKEAAIRETLEETGYAVTLTAVLGLSTLSAGNGQTYYRVSFLADCPAHPVSTDLDPDIDAVIWMPTNEILSADNLRSHLVKMDVNRYLSGRTFPLDMIDESNLTRFN